MTTVLEVNSELKAKFTDLHPGLKARIERIAEWSSYLRPLGVFALWVKYWEQPTDSDQSSIIEEFIRRNAGNLGIVDTDEVIAHVLA